MHIHINGVRLYFDIEGAGLRPDGPRMREMPTLVLLHGGPGADHTLYKPAFSALTDVAQVVYLDHRGNGRSDAGPSELWTLAQWADDLKAFCDALGIVKPVVYGASFGGMLAMSYATRFPDHPGKLVLVSTSAQAQSHIQAKVAMFRSLGGDTVGDLAHRRFVQGDTSDEVLKAWLEQALPLYTQSPFDEQASQRLMWRREVTAWFNRPGGEGRTLDILSDLSRIHCPTLLMGGELDPMLPIECQRDIAAVLRPELLTYREFANCGHGVVPDMPREAMALLRSFIAD